MVRNALIAAGNSADERLLPQVMALLDDPAPVVRGAAAWALLRLDPERFAEARTRRMAVETEALVLRERAGCDLTLARRRAQGEGGDAGRPGTGRTFEVPRPEQGDERRKSGPGGGD